jgi:hypothetical protein
MQTPRFLSAVALCSVLLAACGSPEEPVGPASQPSPTSSGSAILYTCGGPSFDPAKLEGPGNLEDEESALGEALRALLATPDGAMGGAESWRILSQDEEQVVVGAPSPGDDHAYVSATFRRAGSGWEAAGWGDCSPKADIGKRSIALWELTEPVNEGTTEVQISVHEVACSSGRKLKEEQIQVDVEYREDSISILTSADPLAPQEAYNCIGNPSTSITVRLDEPVGDRKLVDAGAYPPS